MLGRSAAQAPVRNALQAETPLAMTPGAPAGSYPLSGFDNVNLYNGNLNFSLPLLKIGGRGEVEYTVRLTLEQHWHVDHTALVVATGVAGDPFQGGTLLHNFEAIDGNFSSPFTRPSPAQLSAAFQPAVIRGRTTGAPKNCNVADDGHTPIFTQAATSTVLVFTAPDGTEYNLYDQLTGGKPLSGQFDLHACIANDTNRGRVFVTTDGSSATFVSDTDFHDSNSISTRSVSGNIYFPNGLVYQIEPSQTQFPGPTGLKQITDHNGNQIVFTYEDVNVPLHWGRVTTITDPLGRVVTFTYSNVTGNSYDEIIYPGFNGANRTIKILHGVLVDALRADYPQIIPTMQMLFNEPLINQGLAKTYNPPVITGVELPDGRQYRFRYNPHGEIARVDLPTGGAYEYDYGSGVPASVDPQGNGVLPITTTEVQIYRRIVERRVFSDGTAQADHKEHFQLPVTTIGTDILPTTQVEEDITAGGALLAKSIHYFKGDPAASFSPSVPPRRPRFNEGREFKTESYDFDGQKILRTVVNDLQNAPFPGCQLTNPLAPNNLPYSFENNFPYNPRNMDTTVTLENGQSYKTTYQYDCFNNVIETDEFDYGTAAPTRITKNTYLTVQTVGGSTTDYVNAANDLSKILFLRRLLTNKTLTPGAGAPAAVTTYNYDEDGSPLTDRPSIIGHSSAFAQSYRARGNLTSATIYTNASPLSGPLTTSSTYDIAGNVVSNTDPMGHVTRYDFDPTGNAFAFVSTTTLPAADATSPALFSSEAHDFNTGLLISATDLNGQHTMRRYDDPLDRLTSILRPDGGSTVYQYGDAVGDLNLHEVASLDVARNLEAYTYFDGLGRTRRNLRFEGTTGAPWMAKEVFFDAVGRVAAVSTPHSASGPSAAQTPCGSSLPCTTTTYDALGRVVKTATSDGASVSTVFTGNSAASTDEALRTRTAIMDALGRLVQVIENPANLNQEPSQTTVYAYNVLDKMIEITQGIQQRFFMYDAAGRRIREFSPEEGPNPNLDLADPLTGNTHWSAAFVSDNNGNVLSKADARGVITTNTYDGLDRGVTQSFSDGTPTVTNSYDGTGVLPVPSNSLGRLTGVRSSVASYTLDGYDSMGRVLGSTETVDNQSYAMQYRYDLAGNSISEKYPSGRTLLRGTDAAGRISSISAPATNAVPYAEGIQYAPHGGISDLRLGNGLWQHGEYDRNRLQTTEVRVGTTKGASDVLGLQYDYGTSNNNGNVLRQVITAPLSTPGSSIVLSQLAKYDAFNRLSAAQEVSGNILTWQQTAIWEQDFILDRWGNRTGLAATGGLPTSGPAPAIDQATNRFVVTAGNGFTYDHAGNLTQEPVDTGSNFYIYDANNHLIQSQSASGTVNYSYDGLGRRVKKVIGSQITIFIYDAIGQLIAEYSNTSPPNNGTRYFTTDLLGSTRLVTDSGQRVVARYDYLPFGELVPPGFGSRLSVAGYSTIGLTKQLFNGKERDFETNLDYFMARYYSNEKGRFTSPDTPFAGWVPTNPQTLNLYAFVLNDPLSTIDPSGHMASDEGWDGDGGDSFEEDSESSGLPMAFMISKRKKRETQRRRQITQEQRYRARVKKGLSKPFLEPPAHDEAKDATPSTVIAAGISLLDQFETQLPSWKAIWYSERTKRYVQEGIPVNEWSTPIPPGGSVYFEPSMDTREMPSIRSADDHSPKRIFTGFGYWYGVPLKEDEANPGSTYPAYWIPKVGAPQYWKSTNDVGCGNEYLNKVRNADPDFYYKVVAPKMPK
jgi:RHS repeat-associated protein